MITTTCRKSSQAMRTRPGRSVCFCRWAALALLLAVGFAQAAFGSSQDPSTALTTAAPASPVPKTLSEGDSRRVGALAKAIDAFRRDGKFNEAIEPARQALAICEKDLGAGHWQTADMRRWVVTLRTTAALPVEGRRALASLPGLNAAGEAAYAQARYEEAANLRRRALELSRCWLGEHHPYTATSYNNLATVLHDRGDLPGAEAMNRKALAIYRGVLGERHPNTATSYNNIGAVLHDRADLTGAETMFRKALAIRLELLGERHPDTTASYNDLGEVLKGRGDLPGAEAMHRKALEVRLATLGERDLNTVVSYNNLANVLHARGDLPGAEAMNRKALAIRLEVLGERHPHTAASYGNLAHVLHARGDLPGAETMLRKALAIRLEVLGERHPDTAGSYNNLASLLHDRADLPGAVAMARKALAIKLEVLGERHPDTASTYTNLAHLLGDRGDLPASEAMFRKALAIRLELLGERHPNTANSYTNLAVVLSARRDLPGAEAMARKALAINLATLGERHPDTVTSYAWLGDVLAGLDRTAEAIDALESAARASTEVRKRSRGFEDAAADMSNPFPALATLLARAGRSGDAWNRWERGLSRALLDEVAGRAARPLTDDDRQRETALLGQAQASDERISRLLASGKPTPEVEKQLDALRSEGNEVRRGLLELQQQFERKYGPLAGQPVTLEAAHAALDDASAFVGWLDFPRFHCACVVRWSGDPIWAEIRGSGKDGAWTKDEETLARRLRAALASRSGDDWHSLAAALARQRLAPLEPHLKGVKRVIVVNSPGLAGLPVEVLFAARAQAGQAAPVVSYAPSASMFAYLAGKKTAQPQPATLLAVGDPHIASPKKPESPSSFPNGGVLVVHVEYDRKVPDGIEPGDVVLSYRGYRITTPGSFRDTNLEIARKSRSNPASQPPPLRATVWREGRVKELVLDPHPKKLSVDERPVREAVEARRHADQPNMASRAETWEHLPGTRREVKAVTGLFPEGRATTLLGDEARESVVQEIARSGKLRGFRYLLFATHGRNDPASAFRTALLLAPDPDRTADPLAVDTDGEITALEIARTWDLDAELVVLSACESGLGKEAGGEGFLGFAQPLLAKGARSLVLSLWRVDDKATSLFMARFYQNLLGKRPGLSKPLPKAEALHEAKEWLRNLTQDEVGNELAILDRGPERPLVKPSGPTKASATPGSKAAGVRPYAHPYYWAAFILIGDPG
jgi:CHAT domain-containing protein/tetratricopeptide (TPR) repeat protein